jgi:hypothetical protein
MENEVTKKEKQEFPKSELTSLPEKWCILRTPESAEIIERWFNKGSKEVFCTNNYSWLYYNEKLRIKSINHVSGKITEHYDYTEITTDQFKKWVLKEEDKNFGPKNGFTKEEVIGNIAESSGTMKEIRKEFLINQGYTFERNGNIELRKKSGGCIGFGSIDAAYEYAVRQSDEHKPPIVEFVEDERKVIGWKFKPEYLDYVLPASVICETDAVGFKKIPEGSKVLFYKNSSNEKLLQKAGVLDIWFEPVFEEVKEMVNKDKISRSMLELDFAYNYKGSIYDSINEMTFNDKRIHFLLGKIAELQLKIEANDI